MKGTNMEPEWTIDETLGVAVREVESVLWVRPDTVEGVRKIYAVLKTLYGESFCDWPTLGHGYWVNPANRLAFARAMGQSFHPLGNAWSPEAFAVVRGTGNCGAASALSLITDPEIVTVTT